MKDDAQFMTISDVARQLRCSDVDALKLAGKHEVPSVNVGGQLLVPRSAWNEWLREHHRASLSQVREAAAERRIRECDAAAEAEHLYGWRNRQLERGDSGSDGDAVTELFLR